MNGLKNTYHGSYVATVTSEEAPINYLLRFHGYECVSQYAY